MGGRNRALLVLAGSNVLWAGSYVAGKAVLVTWPFASLNMLRFSIATVVLAPVLWHGRRALPRDRGDRWRLVAMCALGFVANKALEYWGLSLTTATDTALLIAAEALATVLLSVLILGERLRRVESLGLLAGTVGVYLVVTGGLGWPRGATGPGAVGNLLVVAALGIEAVFTVLGASMVRRYPPLLLTAATVAGSLAVWWPAGLAALAARHWPGLTAGGWVGAAYLGVISTAVCYWGWFYGLRRVMPGRLAPLLFIQPLVGTGLAVVIRGEHPPAAALAGGALILLGVATVVQQRQAPPSSPPAVSGTA
ncbi:MAG TPA: DMT family transporter [Candidatus Dormibacteraeota bacterium]|nr:DMT family transporter [Candidatus Dormibacteraeota bacterium]